MIKFKRTLPPCSDRHRKSEQELPTYKKTLPMCEGETHGGNTMKARLAKIFSILSLIMMLLGAISLVIFFNHNFNVFGDPSFYEWILIFSTFLGWIPTLIFSVLGIVFSWLAKKGKKIFAVSIATCILSVCWGLWFIL